MRQVSILKLKVRVLLIFFAISILALSVTFIIFNIFQFPYTRQNVYTYMETYNVLDFQEIESSMIYVLEAEEGYLVKAFVPSFVLNRYRLQIHSEYGESFVAAVQGRFRYFVLEIENSAIGYTMSDAYRIQANHIIGSLTFIISIMLLLSIANKLYLKKRNKHKQTQPNPTKGGLPEREF